MKEIDFNPNTMTRATQADISRIWNQLWGEWPVLITTYYKYEDGEMLDRTQNEITLCGVEQ
jgi:hypothetical protein